MNIPLKTMVSVENETTESTNFARIACLIMQEGTERMMAITLQNLPPRQTLEQALKANESTFKYLKKKGIVSEAQFSILYPLQGDLGRIDMTLWMILARNLTEKTRRHAVNWRNSPRVHETAWQHDFIRLKEIRNYLFHVSSPELADEKFREIKMELVSTLKRLGSSEDVINRLLSRDLDPQQTSVYVMKLKQQYLEERWVETARRRRHTKILIFILTILALLVAAGISMPIYWYSKQEIPCADGIIRLRSDSGILNFMPRSGWGARPPTEPETLLILQKPVKMAVVFHTAMVYTDCSVTADCCGVVRYLQAAEMDGIINPNILWQDIAYNYLIGNDGVVYEGRGSHYLGGAVWRRTALMALYVFLEYIQWDDPLNVDEANKKPILSPDYKLYGQCQVNLITPEHNVTFQDSPGAATMWEIRYWKHWDSANITQCDVDKDCLVSYNCCKKPCNNTKLSDW